MGYGDPNRWRSDRPPVLVACGGNSSQPDGQGAAAPAPSGGLQINGAGATFPNPIYSKWLAEYERLHPDVRINYQPIGSGGGIRQLSSRTVFFGASDVPMSEEQVERRPGPMLHFPTTLGAVVPVYNLEGSPDLKFTGELLANIYLGRITELERRGDREAESGREAAGDRHRGGAPVGGVRHDVHLPRLPCEGLARVPEGGGRERLGGVAGGHRRQGQRGRHRAGVADARRHRLRRARVHPAKQGQLRCRAESGR